MAVYPTPSQIGDSMTIPGTSDWPSFLSAPGRIGAGISSAFMNMLPTMDPNRIYQQQQQQFQQRPFTAPLPSGAPPLPPGYGVTPPSGPFDSALQQTAAEQTLLPGSAPAVPQGSIAPVGRPSPFGGGSIPTIYDPSNPRSVLANAMIGYTYGRQPVNFAVTQAQMRQNAAANLFSTPEFGSRVQYYMGRNMDLPAAQARAREEVMLAHPEIAEPYRTDYEPTDAQTINSELQQGGALAQNHDTAPYNSMANNGLTDFNISAPRQISENPSGNFSFTDTGGSTREITPDQFSTDFQPFTPQQVNASRAALAPEVIKGQLAAQVAAIRANGYVRAAMERAGLSLNGKTPISSYLPFLKDITNNPNAPADAKATAASAAQAIAVYILNQIKNNNFSFTGPPQPTAGGGDMMPPMDGQ